MEFVPRPPDHRSWRPERAVSVADALEAWLDHAEAWNRGETVPSADDFPISTGLLPLDLVLGGGLRPGTVTLLCADRVVHGDALLFTIARTAPHDVLLVGRDLLSITQRLLAGAAGVPEVLLATQRMGEPDWAALCAAIPGLAGRNLRLGEADSLGGLRHVVRENPATVVLVHEAGRLGGPRAVVGELVQVAAAHRCRVVAPIPPPGELLPSSGPVYEHVEQVEVTAVAGGTRARMVRPDPLDMLSVATAEIDELALAAGEVAA